MAEGNGMQQDIGFLKGMVKSQGETLDAIAADMRRIAEKQGMMQGTMIQLASSADRLSSIEVKLNSRIEKLEQFERQASNRRSKLIGVVIGVSIATSATAVTVLEKLRVIFHTTQIGGPQP